tara:strand:+ start:1952 stop:2173 length:222 start_codon:yes stop_codon:yes gene_type:complete
MRQFNPGAVAYANMDIENFNDDLDTQETKSGLLAPRKKPMGNMNKEMASQPAYRVAQHMKVLRKHREAMKQNG